MSPFAGDLIKMRSWCERPVGNRRPHRYSYSKNKNFVEDCVPHSFSLRTCLNMGNFDAFVHKGLQIGSTTAGKSVDEIIAELTLCEKRVFTNRVFACRTTSRH